jgi:hypothetical protein
MYNNATITENIMPIISSAITNIEPQIDKRLWVTEQHLDQFGIDHSFSYLADADADINAKCSDHASSISAEMQLAEITNNVQQGLTQGANAVLTFNESTIAQSLAALSGQFDNIVPAEISSMLSFLTNLPNEMLTTDLSLTDAQILMIQDSATTFDTAMSNAMQTLQMALNTALAGG